MNFNDYQKQAITTAIYPRSQEIIYPALGLCGESGEVAEKVKKTLRDSNGFFDVVKRDALAKELGDVLWYIANLANDLDFDLSDIAQGNLDKLKARHEKGTLQGNGDDR